MKEAARRAAQAHLPSTPGAGRPVRIEDPLPVTQPGGAPAGWLVGIVVGERLVGFLQFDLESRVLRTSWFPMRSESLEGCPLAVTWLDASAVSRRARELLESGEELDAPRLTYDREPSRLQWLVPVRVGSHPRGSIAVVGDSAFRVGAPPNDETG
ncbi:MAG: hypothetical protein M5U28_23560 [Sandaracinaceae bacterium]|nr:hypothetical protein [Sandaracinaceae bacterium]